MKVLKHKLLYHFWNKLNFEKKYRFKG